MPDYFPEAEAQRFFEIFEKTGDIAAIDGILRLAIPLVQKLISTRQTFLFVPANELVNDCLVRLADRLTRNYSPARGRMFSFCTRVAESALVDAVRRQSQHAGRLVAIDDRLEGAFHTNGEVTSRECMDDIVHRLSRIQTVFTKTREVAAQRWLLVNLIMDGFCYRRWQAGDAMSLVFALPPRRSRQIYDATVLEARRVLLGERKIPSTLGYNLSGTRSRALMRYKSQLSAQDFSRLCFVMRNLAPQALIGSGLYSLTEILNGSLRARPLFGPTESLTSDMSETAPFRFQLEPAEEKARSARRLAIQSPMPAAAVSPSRRSVIATEKPRVDLAALKPTPLLAGSSQTEFTRNLREIERQQKRSYSLARAIRETMEDGAPSSVCELEVDQELRVWTGQKTRPGSAFLAPLEALDYRRDLDSASSSALVPLRVEDSVIPFLRNKTTVGKMGATILTALAPGSHSLPRATDTTGATWLAETDTSLPTSPLFDTVVLVPYRIMGTCQISRNLLRLSAPSIDEFVANDIRTAIAAAVDQACLNGGGSPSPTGILHQQVNSAGAYLYTKRSPDVPAASTAPTWASILEFSTNLEAARVDNTDGTLGFIASPDVRALWQNTAIMATYPRFLWEAGPALDGIGTVNGLKAISSYNMPPATVVCGRWSDCLIGTWQGVEVMVDNYSLASSNRIRVLVSLLVGINFRYTSAFCASVT
jgi:HK97 family phage major capsid protein